MSLPTAITDFFDALRGPDPTDGDTVPADTQRLLDNNAAHQRRINELELELHHLKQHNAALHARDQATQKEIADCLAVANGLAAPDYRNIDKAVARETKEVATRWKEYVASVARFKDERFNREAAAWKAKYSAFEADVAKLSASMETKLAEVCAAAENSAKQVVKLTGENAVLKTEIHLAISDHKKTNAGFERFKKETSEWKTKFADTVRRQCERERIEEEQRHDAELEEAKEYCETLAQERDSAVEKIDILEQDYADEQLLHEIAADIAQRLQHELDVCRENYEWLHEDWMLLKKAVVQGEEAFAAVSDARTATLWEIHELKENYSDLLRKSKADEEAYAVLAKAHALSINALRHFKQDVDELTVTVDKITEGGRAARRDVETLRKKYDRLRLREKFLRKSLSRSEAACDAVTSNLETALAQREDALKGQLEALKMVEKVKSGMITDDGKEISVWDGDEDVVAGDAEGSDGDGIIADEGSDDIVEVSQREVSEEVIKLISEHEASDDDYDDCGDSGCGVDVAYEHVGNDSVRGEH